MSHLSKKLFRLSLDTYEFDLIWVDGAHGYPVVTTDIINALRLAKIRADCVTICSWGFKTVTVTINRMLRMKLLSLWSMQV